MAEILVVDDSKLAVKMLEDRDEMPDLVISDLKMKTSSPWT